MRKREKNRMRETIQRGEVALGTCLCAFSPTIAEVAGHSGLVWCRIDNEHAWRQDESLEHLLRSANYAGIVPLLRVDKGYPDLVRKGLEAGAGGVIVPHTLTAKDAQDIVDAAKFPDLGHRGFSNLCFSGRWGVGGPEDGLEWIEWSNQETLVIPMIEDIEAIPNLEAIVSTEGVDGVFFGAADLSVSAGVPLQANHPQVVDALKKTISTVRKFGKFVIFGAKYPWWDDIDRLVEMGVQAIEIGHDISVLSTIWKKSVEHLNRLKN